MVLVDISKKDLLPERFPFFFHSMPSAKIATIQYYYRLEFQVFQFIQNAVEWLMVLAVIISQLNPNKKRTK